MTNLAAPNPQYNLRLINDSKGQGSQSHQKRNKIHLGSEVSDKLLRYEIALGIIAESDSSRRKYREKIEQIRPNGSTADGLTQHADTQRNT